MDNGRIGLMGAMQEEVALLMDKLERTEIVHKAGITFHQGMIGEQQVVLCKCGVGKVNAALCSQILIDDFNTSTILFTGVAGALHPDLNIGDIVISTDCMQHDIDASALGFERGTIPFAEHSIFKASPVLIKLAEQAGKEQTTSHVMKGRVLSGDQFIADRSRVEELHQSFSGVCTEMEGSAVAQVCSLNGVSFVIIRSMSDKADGSAHMNFAEFTKKASDNSYRIVLGMLKNINT